MTYHKSVLIKEVIEGLHLQPNGLYVDVTFGGGGHTSAILQAEPTCKVIALDWDQTAIFKNASRLQEEFGERFKVIFGNFANLHRILKKEKILQVNGILADFGTSQFQIHHQAGFSFRADTPLDMRMSASHSKITAAHVINKFDEKEIARIFFEFGEESKSRLIARTIVEQRKQKRISTTKELAELVESVIPRRGSKIHPATKVFQALRIYVNNELDNIETFLKAATQVLAPGGRLVCISFHSLEDRIVKNFFREQSEYLSIITRKPITPEKDEISQNRASRSAKLRTAEKRSDSHQKS